METSKRPPWHFWLIAILSLVWNLIGATDFYMTQTENIEYMAQFSPEQLEFFYSFPQWVNMSWAIAIGGAVIGSLLLLLRLKWAVGAFTIALIAMIITAIHNFALSDISMAQIAGTEAIIFTLVIFVISVTLIFYARYATAKGYLR